MEPSEHQAGHWEPSTAVPGELFICIGQEMVEAWPALQGGRQIHRGFFREGKVVLLQCQPLERKPGSGAKEEATWPRLWSTHELDGQHLAQPLLDWALLSVFFMKYQLQTDTVGQGLSRLPFPHCTGLTAGSNLCALNQWGKPLDTSLVCSFRGNAISSHSPGLEVGAAQW